MKKKIKSSSKGRFGKRLLAVAAIGLILMGLYWGFQRLNDLWTAPCYITNAAEQIVLEGTEYVPGDSILSICGLTNGVNLAECARQFEDMRKRVLERIPNLRDITLTRHYPNHLLIKVSERKPVARLKTRTKPRRIGYVVDEDGVVFLRIPNTQMLPEIWEATPTPKGKTLEGRSAAALDLVMACRDRELEKLGLSAVDATSPDYLLISFGESRTDRAKVDWEGRGQPTEKARKALRQTLKYLKQAVDTRLGERAVMWNATIPNRIFADTKEPIQ